MPVIPRCSAPAWKMRRLTDTGYMAEPKLDSQHASLSDARGYTKASAQLFPVSRLATALLYARSARP